MKIPTHLYKYIIALFAITLFVRLVLVGYCHNNLGGIEPNVIYGIQRILLGQHLYQDPSASPYAIMQYTPLYYHFAASVARALGVDGLDVQGIYVVCRALALVFNLLTVLLAALIIRTWKFGWGYSMVFATPVLIMLTSHYYTRGDSMHLLLFTGTVYAYILYSRKKRLWQIVVAALLSAGCIMVKQSGVLVIGITGFCLLFMERKIIVAVFYGLCTAIFAGAIAWLYLGSDNWHAFYQNAYLGLKNGIDPSFLYLIFTSQFFLDMVPCYVLGGVMVMLATKKIPDKTFRILATGALLSWLFAVVTGLKIGSSNNYFIEFLLFVITALPYLLQSEAAKAVLFKLFGKEVTIRTFALIAFFVLTGSKTMGIFSSVFIEKSLKNKIVEYGSEKMLYRYFEDTLHLAQGDHLFFGERRFLDNIFIKYAVIPNRDVTAQTYSSDHNTFDYSSFTGGMNAGSIKYIVTDEKKDDLNEWNKEMPFLFFDKTKFRLLDHRYGYSIYVFSPHKELNTLNPI